MYPIAAIRAAPATNGPRTPTRSEMNALATITIKHNTYGGAERPLDWIALNLPISEMIVGTKRGRDAKQTLQPKYIRGGRKLRQSRRAPIACFHWKESFSRSPG